MIREKSSKPKKIVIDLTGPQGNAFFLIGTTVSLLKQMEMPQEKIDQIVDDMTCSDYENLLKVMDHWLYDIVILER